MLQERRGPLYYCQEADNFTQTALCSARVCGLVGLLIRPLPKRPLVGLSKSCIVSHVEPTCKCLGPGWSRGSLVKGPRNNTSTAGFGGPVLRAISMPGLEARFHCSGGGEADDLVLRPQGHIRGWCRARKGQERRKATKSGAEEAAPRNPPPLGGSPAPKSSIESPS